ncbi:MAG: FHA domain-containing protein [Bacteroides sp.]|nr:FHA domain-containing protein [Bacteroides sp.]MBD5305953.1 FHA domain-containing protein [Bacteroides sp.]
MDEIIQIKCPFDGAVLSVKNQPCIESKNVTCPICKHKYPFTQFKRVYQTNSNDDLDTEYPGYEEEKTSYAYGNNSNENTDLGQMNFTLGKLKILGGSGSYQLKPGRNVIGRKGQKSEANFQIDTGGKRSMSREHIVIEVKKIPGKGFVHYISLFKEKVNKTYIGNEHLIYGDCVVLAHGDVIKLPDVNLKFEIPDDEATDI